MLVLTVTATGIARIVAFQNPGLFGSFGLPPEYCRAGPAQDLGGPSVAPLSRGLELLESAVSYALAGAALGTPQLLRRPTPCPGWDLETLLDHVSDSIRVLPRYRWHGAGLARRLTSGRSGLPDSARHGRFRGDCRRRNPAGLYKWAAADKRRGTHKNMAELE